MQFVFFRDCSGNIPIQLMSQISVLMLSEPEIHLKAARCYLAVHRLGLARSLWRGAPAPGFGCSRMTLLKQRQEKWKIHTSLIAITLVSVAAC